jgi:hypothetical protein
VLHAAYEKLFSGPWFDPRNERHVFAARIGLEIAEAEAYTRLVVEAVRSLQKLVITAPPFEPILAIAAASTLNRSPEMYRDAIDILLDELILQGLIIDRGI